MAYVYLMANKKSLSLEIVKKHVQYLKEAKAIAESDPFIEEGYKTFELRTLSVANKDNNYGLSMD